MREGRLAATFALLLLMPLGATAAERTLKFDSSVHGVEFAGQGTVRIALGAAPGVRLEAEQRALLDAYDVEVRGDTLVIERRDRRSLWPFGRDDDEQNITVEITVEALDRVAFAGAGELVLASIHGDQLDVELSGAGQCTLGDLDVTGLALEISGAGSCTANGTADQLRVEISGAGDFDAEALAARIVRVELSGAADARFDVSEALDASVSGAGSIAYRGRPAVRQRISGFGSIEQID